MGIDASWTTENGEFLQRVLDPRECLSLLANTTWPSLTTSVCVRFIDPYGDVKFNQAQIPLLLAELKESLVGQTDSEITMHLGKVIRMVERSVGEKHTYIEFFGD